MKNLTAVRRSLCQDRTFDLARLGLALILAMALAVSGCASTSTGNSGGTGVGSTSSGSGASTSSGSGASTSSGSGASTSSGSGASTSSGTGTGSGGGGAVEQPGSYSHATDTQFCSTHQCIENFPNGNGSIVQCVDGEWSHSGGLSGACSDHGGEA